MKKQEEKTVEKTLTNAYVIPAEAGDSIIKALGRLPWNEREIYGPVLQYLEQQVYRGDVTIQVPDTPNQAK